MILMPISIINMSLFQSLVAGWYRPFVVRKFGGNSSCYQFLGGSDRFFCVENTFLSASNERNMEKIFCSISHRNLNTINTCPIKSNNIVRPNTYSGLHQPCQKRSKNAGILLAKSFDKEK